MIGDDKVKDMFWGPMYFNMQLKLAGERLKLEENEKALYRNIVEALKTAKIGNCYDEAKLAEIIGKVNGQKNIYSGKIFCNNDKMAFHEVAIITDNEVLPNKKCELKDRNTVVLDPWLNTTEFAEQYLVNLKSGFKKFFPDLKRKRKINLKFEPDFTRPLTGGVIRTLKSNYPELIIKDYKKIKL